MVVMLVAIVLFSVIKFDFMILNLVVRIALMPLVAVFPTRSSVTPPKRIERSFKLMTAPGLWLQNITTQEPDEEQLEVAIEALNESLKLEPQRSFSLSSLHRAFNSGSKDGSCSFCLFHDIRRLKLC